MILKHLAFHLFHSPPQREWKPTLENYFYESSINIAFSYCVSHKCRDGKMKRIIFSDAIMNEISFMAYIWEWFFFMFLSLLNTFEEGEGKVSVRANNSELEWNFINSKRLFIASLLLFIHHLQQRILNCGLFRVILWIGVFRET